MHVIRTIRDNAQKSRVNNNYKNTNRKLLIQMCQCGSTRSAEQNN